MKNWNFLLFLYREERNLPLVFGRALRYTGVERITAREVL